MRTPEERFARDVAHRLRDHMRDVTICIHHEVLREVGVSHREAVEKLAEKYCLSVKRIENIIYSKERENGKEK